MMMAIKVTGREVPLNAPSVLLMDCSFNLLIVIFLYICRCFLKFSYFVANRQMGSPAESFLELLYGKWSCLHAAYSLGSQI